MTTGKYILDGHIPVECTDLHAWARWYETAHEERIVKQDPTPDGKVSTVFLGLDHSFSRDPSGPPILFETLVFGGPLDGEMQRYSTWDEAEKGHELMLTKVRASL